MKKITFLLLLLMFTIQSIAQVLIPTAMSVDFDVCDDSSRDSEEQFDLASHNVLILDGQSSTDFNVTYYLTEVDANAGTSPLGMSYTNTTNPQTIWVRVEDNTDNTNYVVVDFDLNVNELPVTTFASNFATEICKDTTDPIIITATPQNYSASEVDIVWYQDGGVIQGASGLKLSVLKGGLYEIQATFKDTQCQASPVGVNIVQLGKCIIPQGISPNNDGKNDTFDLSYFNVTRIEIFNRLGTLVYSKDNYTNEWHGQTDKGDELPVGTYFYTLQYEGGAKKMSAWVYLNK